MNFNLVEMYNGLLRFNKHILNELLIKLLNSIVDYTNNTELEQDIKVITQKHNELVETVNELKTKIETYSDKINKLEQRVQQLENSSQS